MSWHAAAAALALALLLVPSGLGGWGGKGTWEPDTAQDAQAPFMWPDPDNSTSSGVRRVYFNGFSGAVLGVSTTVNPNAASLRTGVQTHPYQPYALLGVWKDCNNDGYIGLGENGALDYRNELLLDKSVCPVRAGDPHAHNDGAWVHELVPIGYDDVRAALDGSSVEENPYNLNDTGARVWADWGLPGAAPRGSCVLDPAPYGTYRSTGGFLRWADCLDDYAITQNASAAFERAGHEEMSFRDAPRDRPDESNSTLNVANPWGRPDDAAMVRAFDCAARPRTWSVHDPTDPGDGSGALHSIAAVPLPGGQTIYVNLTDREGRIVNKTTNEPAGPFVDLAGSPAGTVDEAEEGLLQDCRRGDGNSTAQAPYLLEGPSEPVSGLRPRTRSDHVFKFEEGDRRSPVFGLTLGARARADAGLAATDLSGLWVGQGSTATSRNPFLAREDLRPEQVTYVTFYAHVTTLLANQWGLQLPAGSAAAYYGAEGCGQRPPTFACDEASWWKDTVGQDVMPRDYRLGAPADARTTPHLVPATEIGVRVGHPYQLRDVDCFDASAQPLRERNVQYGLLSGTACVRPGSGS